jgi:hypothetical protein
LIVWYWHWPQHQYLRYQTPLIHHLRHRCFRFCNWCGTDSGTRRQGTGNSLREL